MHLGHWPGRWIGRLWIAGLALQGAILLVLRLAAAPIPESPLLRAMDARDDSVQRGLLPPAQPISAADRERLLAALRRDSVTIEHRGDTVVVRGPAYLERAAQQVAQGFGQVVRDALLAAAAVFLPIPLTLVSLTGGWLWARRRERARVRQAAV